MESNHIYDLLEPPELLCVEMKQGQQVSHVSDKLMKRLSKCINLFTLSALWWFTLNMCFITTQNLYPKILLMKLGQIAITSDIQYKTVPVVLQ